MSEEQVPQTDKVARMRVIVGGGGTRRVVSVAGGYHHRCGGMDRGGGGDARVPGVVCSRRRHADRSAMESCRPVDSRVEAAAVRVGTFRHFSLLLVARAEVVAIGSQSLVGSEKVRGASPALQRGFEPQRRR